MLDLRWIVAVLAMSLVLLPITSHAQGQNTVSGTVLYLERIALPPTAKVTVRLLDVSRADAAATTLAEQTIDTAGKAPPYAFSLSYDPAQIQDSMSYAVRAEIRDGDDLLFTTTQSYPVITRGNPTSNVEIRVSRVSSVDAPSSGSTTPPASSPNTLPTTGAPLDMTALILLLALFGLAGGLLMHRLASGSLRR